MQSQGSAWQNLYYILKGAITRTFEKSSGEVVALQEHRIDSILGVEGYFARGLEAPGLVASTDTELARISYQHLSNVLKQRPPDYRQTVAAGLVTELTRQVSGYENRLADVLRVGVKQKLCSAIITLAHARGTVEGGIATVKVHRYELAQLVGCCVGTAQVALRQLVADGQVKLEGKSVMSTCMPHT